MIEPTKMANTQKPARERLIVALDVSTVAEAERIIGELQGVTGMFKIGYQLFSAAGPRFVRELVKRGEKIFLDLKFHDIPNTVSAAGVEATRLGVSMFNVHACGGSEMMLQTRDAVDKVVSKEGLVKPYIIAVTVLTSSTDATLSEVGITATADEQVKRLALLTESAGLDGIVASPREVTLVREAVKNNNFLLVTPGVRPGGVSSDDQMRVMTPNDAIAAGADFLVIGRPITGAAEPRVAAERILQEMSKSLPER